MRNLCLLEMSWARAEACWEDWVEKGLPCGCWRWTLFLESEVWFLGLSVRCLLLVLNSLKMNYASIVKACGFKHSKSQAARKKTSPSVVHGLLLWECGPATHLPLWVRGRVWTDAVETEPSQRVVCSRALVLHTCLVPWAAKPHCLGSSQRHGSSCTSAAIHLHAHGLQTVTAREVRAWQIHRRKGNRAPCTAELNQAQLLLQQPNGRGLFWELCWRQVEQRRLFPAMKGQLLGGFLRWQRVPDKLTSPLFLLLCRESCDNSPETCRWWRETSSLVTCAAGRFPMGWPVSWNV